MVWVSFVGRSWANRSSAICAGLTQPMALVLVAARSSTCDGKQPKALPQPSRLIRGHGIPRRHFAAEFVRRTPASARHINVTKNTAPKPRFLLYVFDFKRRD